MLLDADWNNLRSSKSMANYKNSTEEEQKALHMSAICDEQ
jgi:hypothetical protein